MANYAAAKLILRDHRFDWHWVLKGSVVCWRQKRLTMIAKTAYKPRTQVIIEAQGRENAMANHKSSKKRIIRNANRAFINSARMARIRTFVKKVEIAIAAGDAQSAREALRQAQPEMQRGVSRGILHKNTVSRKISRLSARVKALAA